MLRILHIILAINLLLSSTGVTVFEHLCQMKGKSVSVFLKPNGCCKQKQSYKTLCQGTRDCKLDNGQQITRKPCCQDKSQFVKSNMDGALQKIALPDFYFQVFNIQSIPQIVLKLDIIPNSQKTLRFCLYKPPPQVTDIRVFIQSFLC